MNVKQLYENLTSFQNKKLLFDKKVIDAFQFLLNSAQKLRKAEIEIDALDYVNNKTKESYAQWNKNLFENGQTDFLPITIVEYFGTKMSDDDAIEKIAESYFHYLHSFFDSFAQFINTALLGNMAVDINNVSFAAMRKKLQGFPEYQLILSELDTFAQTSEFQYIEDFNNINKHQYTIDVQSTMTLNDGQIEQEIPKFQKKGIPHDAKQLNDKITNSLVVTLRFFESVTNMIFDHLKQNLHNYTINRYHNVSIKAQLGFGEGQDGGAVILKADNTTFTNGDTFGVLLSKIESDSNKIVVNNIMTDSIIVQNSDGENIAILEALEQVNENIVKYRKYQITLHNDMESIYVQQFFKPKKLQMGFGEGEIIQKATLSDVVDDRDKDATQT